MSSVEFWNRLYAQNEASAPKRVKPRQALRDAVQYFGDLHGRKLIDLGCGDGEASYYFASLGAEVTAVDNSSTAIENLRRLCDEQGITSIRPVVSDALRLADLGPVDFIYGSMILHHIEPFDQFADVLRSTLAPGGKAFFYENSAMSRLLIWFRTHVVGRAWVPKHGDDEEFPLTPGEVDELRRQFHVRIDQPELLFFRLIPNYLLRRKFRTPFAWLDRQGYRLRWLRRYSYRQYLYLAA